MLEKRSWRYIKRQSGEEEEREKVRKEEGIFAGKSKAYSAFKF